MTAADSPVVFVVAVGTITSDQISLPVATLTATVSASACPFTPRLVTVVPIRYTVPPSGLRTADCRTLNWPVFSLAHFRAAAPARLKSCTNAVDPQPRREGGQTRLLMQPTVEGRVGAVSRAGQGLSRPCGTDQA